MRWLSANLIYKITISIIIFVPVSVILFFSPGCSDNTNRTLPNTVANVPTDEIFERSEGFTGSFNGPGYELELIPIAYPQVTSTNDDERRLQNAAAVRDALKNWIEKHKEQRIVSILGLPSVTPQTWISHLLVTSFKHKGTNDKPN